MAEAGSRSVFRWRLPGSRELRLIEGDGIAGLAREPPGSMDVIVTSPPYNINQPYGRYRDRRPRDDYLAWIGRLNQSIRHALAPQGSFFLNVGGPPRDPWLPFDVARAAGAGLELQNVIHWIKSIALDRFATRLDRDLAIGHYRPVASERFLHGTQEYVFHFTRSGRVPLDRLAIGVPYQHPSNRRRWKRPAVDRRCRGNSWFLPYPTIQHRATERPHPATFPESLPEWCLKLHGLSRVRRASDPFVGIGASALAAARLGIAFRGWDIDPDYLDFARRRLERLRRSLAGRTDPSRSDPAPTAPSSRGAGEARPARAATRS
jgi:site-specific DNA-methyltransferase (adenine-specific)